MTDVWALAGSSLAIPGAIVIVALGSVTAFGVGGWLLRAARALHDGDSSGSGGGPRRWYRYLNPMAPLYDFYRHRDLLRQLVRREIESRYRGSYLGLVWSLLNPLWMLALYTFVFSVVLKARWLAGAEASHVGFAVTVFAGLIAFNLFAECLTRAPTLVVSNPNYVKKVVFPLQVLPVVALAVAIFHGAIALVVLLVGNLALAGTLSRTVLLLPLAALPLLALTLGVSWFLASLGAYVRDTSYAVGIVVQALLFLTPVLYPLDAVPEAVRPIIRLNPLTEIVDAFRRTLLWSQPLDWTAWLGATAAALAACCLGYAWFMQTKPGFADVV